MTHIEDHNFNKPNKILTFQSNKIYFTADVHFGHKNIIRFCDRPFEDVNEMDNIMIKKWNEVVGDDDIVFIVGDFCFSGKQKWRHYLNRLNGDKILIFGNHDKSIPFDLFKLVMPLMNIRVIDENLEKYVTLCHYPMVSWYQSRRHSYQLFGHVHEKYKAIYKNQLNVGVDIHDFYPISFQQVTDHMHSDENDVLINEELSIIKNS